jgi:hypothetical protein
MLMKLCKRKHFYYSVSMLEMLNDFSKTFYLKTAPTSLVPVAHACNPSYSGGGDQDTSSKPAQANSFQDPMLKKFLHKEGLAEWLKV